MERVAVVDDDPVFLMMMRDALRPLGVEVLTYNDSNSAFPSLIQSQPDLIILDLRMPAVANGWHVLDLLWLDPLTRTIPVIVCSAAKEELNANSQWLHRRGVAILPKPFALDDLYRAIETGTGRYLSVSGQETHPSVAAPADTVNAGADSLTDSTELELGAGPS